MKLNKFQKSYLTKVVFCEISSTVMAAVFWSNDFTFTRLALNTIQCFIYGFIWMWLELKLEGLVLKLPKKKIPQVKPDEKPVWPPVVKQ